MCVIPQMDYKSPGGPCTCPKVTAQRRIRVLYKPQQGPIVHHIGRIRGEASL